MGGHESKQSVHVSTKVTANIVQTTAQNCINVAYGSNVITVNGNYNIMSGVDQNISISINSDCSTFAAQDSTFNSDLANALSQVLHDQEVAMTQWMDNSSDDENASIHQSVTANFTQATVQNCVNSLDAYNIIDVSGSGNVIKDITQNVTLNIISQCLLQNDQTSSVVSNITNTVNQHSTYTSKNPFAFITDAIEAMMKSALVVAAVIFIVIICFVFIFAIMRREKKGAPSGPIVLQAVPGYGLPAPGVSGF